MGYPETQAESERISDENDMASAASDEFLNGSINKSMLPPQQHAAGLEKLKAFEIKCGTEEGDICGHNGCDGRIGCGCREECSCHVGVHICRVCIFSPLACKKCGHELAS